MVLLAVVIAGGAVLRLHDLGRYGLSGDESVYAGQAQVLAGVTENWPAVRAHPPLLAALLAVMPGHGADDVVARTVVGLIGLGCVPLAWWAARLAAGRLAAWIAAGLVAFDPYHIDVSRQVLVDVPLATAVALVVVAVVGWARSRRRGWLGLGALGLGLALCFKETAVVVGIGLACAVASRRRLRCSRREAAAAGALTGALALAYPIWLVAAGGWGRSLEYLAWQVQRPATGGWDFYATSVAPRLGILTPLAVLGVLSNPRRLDEAVWCLVWLVSAVVLFFVVWPVKGYGYLTMLVVPLSVLASIGIIRLCQPVAVSRPGRRVRPFLTPVTVMAALGATVGQAVWASPPAAATTGVPALREAARWLSSAPPGSVFVGSVGVGNVVTYYSGRRPFTLGLPADLRRRNPAYRSLDGSDARYLVWDAWTQRETPTSAGEIVRRARSSGARVVHVETLEGARGTPVPAVIVYEVVL